MAKNKKSTSSSTSTGIYSGTKVSFIFMVLAIVTGTIGVMSVKGDGIVTGINYALAILGVSLILFSADFLNIKKVYKILIQVASLTLGIVLICISLNWIKIDFTVISLLFGIVIILYSIFLLSVSIVKRNSNLYLVIASFVVVVLVLIAGILYCCMYQNSNVKNLSITAGVFLIIAAVILRYNPLYRVKK